MTVNGVSWSQLFGGYSLWRLPDFPDASDPVSDEAWLDEELIESLAERIGTFYSQNPVNLGFLFSSALTVDSLAYFEFPNPVANTLLRQGFSEVSDLVDLSTVDYLNFRGVGRGNYLSLLKSLVRMNLRLAKATPLEVAIHMAYPAAGESEETDSLSFYNFYNHILLAAKVAPGSAYERLLQAALFASFVDGPDSAVFNLRTTGLSEESANLDLNLSSISAQTLMGGVDVPTFQDMALDFIESLDDKERVVLLKRFLAEEQQTLDEVGVGLGVTRERVRQIAKKLQDKYSEKTAQDRIFGASVSAFRHLTSDPITVADLKKKQRDLFSKLAKVESNPFRFFAGLEDYEIHEGWIYKAQEQQLKEFSEAWAEATDGAKYTTLQELLSVLRRSWPTFTEAKLGNWLEANGYLDYQGFYYYSKGASLVTIAKIVLEVEKKPMTFKALFEATPGATSERAIRHRLLQDPDVVKSGRDSCALKVWGVAEFKNIHKELENLVREKGSQSLDGTIRKFVEQFGVAESAVRAYANAYPLEVIGGQIRLAQARIAAAPRKRPAKNVYKTTDGWAWRITINAEHLRGSGSPCPVFLANQLELTFDKATEFACDEGRVAFTSSALQRNLSSIREVCTTVEAKVGDQIVIRFSGNSAKVSKLDLNLKGEKLIRALAVLPDTGAIVEQLSFALNLDTAKTVEEIIENVSKRKETDLAIALASFDLSSL